MHERSLAEALLDEIARIVLSHGGGNVQEVHLRVGPLSGVEPILLADAFELLKIGTSASSARLVLEEVALLALCGDCGTRFTPERFSFHCPGCGGGHCSTVQGDGLVLQRLVIDSPDEVG